MQADMALFSPAEAVYLTSFLSAVDLDQSVNPDGSVDHSLAERVPHVQGKEALAKATKDLMSLDLPTTILSPPALHRPHFHQAPSLPPPPSSTGPNYWPSIPPPEHSFPPSAVRSSSPARYALDYDVPRSTPSDRALPTADSLFNPPPAHLQIAPLRGSTTGPAASAPAFTLPPISTSKLPPQPHSGIRPSAVSSSASAPVVPTSSKRPLPGSNPPEPTSSKRPRPSPSTSSSPFPDSPGPSSVVSGARGASASANGLGRPRRPPAAAQSKGEGAVAAANGAKPALLSPSQKRANHIQSEQKRRANIRRGYEALCDVVPALREAIRAEDEQERARALEEEAAAAKGRGRGGGGAEKGKKKKGRADGDKADGRAGPKSENVVLSKTIEHISDLLAQRAALQQRLELARGVLPLGHPATAIDPSHLDPNGTPLWEREWNGGMDLDIGPDGDDGSDDEG
ncbi:uncharacterized protein BXZ73DRAFT_96311 [Epithele typhae]|uniref:uncharacterized protein n=1 Tax=Epithele typhae TaxID=378194 RepID=UPI002007EDF0|nr:uncharacterized protein BXZ73DRAFT_96311 [Epithele typhae]KAH9945325.1 hypothetical protein BXZ73DRAFT_96311 [Epithele typhae]